MKHATIPITSINSAKKLTSDQRNLLIILEDVALRFAGAETFALSQLHEMKNNGLFKTEELRDEFLRYFRPLIEKIKPLYGIKEGGEE